MLIHVKSTQNTAKGEICFILYEWDNEYCFFISVSYGGEKQIHTADSQSAINECCTEDLATLETQIHLFKYRSTRALSLSLSLSVCVRACARRVTRQQRELTHSPASFPVLLLIENVLEKSLLY